MPLWDGHEYSIDGAIHSWIVSFGLDLGINMDM